MPEQEAKLRPTVLSIAGSDPTGGAGIQADLKTMTSIGVYGAAAITCLTVQNGSGVSMIEPLSPELVTRQVQAVLSDYRVSQIKIGMVGNLEIARAIGRVLQNFQGQVIYDPVLSASSGQILSRLDAPEQLHQSLIGQVSVLTPNREELAWISGLPVTNWDQAVSAARTILARHSISKSGLLQGVIIKGGHLNNESPEINDLLIRPDKDPLRDSRPRRGNKELHGTGCTYASALSSYLALGHDLTEAFHLAGAYMDQVIQASLVQRISRRSGYTPLLHHLG